MSWPFADKLFAYEAGELNEEETIELFQYMVDTGFAWELQGRIQRTAQDYIDAGLVTLPSPDQPDPEEEQTDLDSCPHCGSYDVAQTAAKPIDGQAEYICQDCGEYFIASQQEA